MTLAAACAGLGPSAAAKAVESDARLLQGHSSQIFTLAFSPDGLTLASGGSDQTIRLWELATGRERKVLRGHGGSVLGLAFAPNDERLASASADGTIRIWDRLQGRELIALTCRFGAFRGVAFAPDGSLVVSGDPKSPRIGEVIPVGQRPNGIWANPEGTRLFVVHEALNDLYVIDAGTGTVVATVPVGRKPIRVVVSR